MLFLVLPTPCLEYSSGRLCKNQWSGTNYNLAMELMETYHPPTRTAEFPGDESTNEMLAALKDVSFLSRRLVAVGKITRAVVQIVRGLLCLSIVGSIGIIISFRSISLRYRLELLLDACLRSESEKGSSRGAVEVFNCIVNR